MPEPDDHQLLAEFAGAGAEPAFAALVARYVNLVYSTALRSTGNAQNAEEITQAVFIILARKAEKLSSRVVLSGWLYQTTRLTAANFMKGEFRRRRREEEAVMQSILNESTDAAWREIAPLLDEAMDRLGQTDRDAVVLRYFENKSAAEIGAALRMNEETARRRVNRAVEKLRAYFVKRGVDSTVATIGETISANSILIAPSALAKTVTAAALAKGAAVSTSTLTLVKGALKIMAWTKVKSAVVASAVVLLTAGTATVTFNEIQARKTYPWQMPEVSFEVFNRMPAAIKIVPTKFSSDGSFLENPAIGVMGIAQPLQKIIELAHINDRYARTVVETVLPTNRYDFFAKLTGPPLPHGYPVANTNWSIELQKQIAKQFGVAGRIERRATDVLALKPVSTGTHGFKISLKTPKSLPPKQSPGSHSFSDMPVGFLVNYLQIFSLVPIVDQTGLAEKYDYSITWGGTEKKVPTLEELKQALRDQLGLELVPTNMPIEMLVVEKAK